MKVLRAEKYGFCAGVRIADKKVKKFARAGNSGAILGQVVHNERVVDEMDRLGVHTVQGLDEVDSGTIVFSAHGVPPSFHDRARERGLKILDTTCPFVYDIHDEAGVALGAGAHLVFIGEAGHREVIGYTHDLDPASYHVVHTLEEAERIDWSRYRADQDLLPDDAQRRGVRGGRPPHRGAGARRHARRHDLLRHQGEPGRRAPARVEPRGRRDRGDRRQALGQHPAPLGDLPALQAELSRPGRRRPRCRLVRRRWRRWV